MLQGMFYVSSTCAFLCKLPFMASCPAWVPHHPLQMGTAERKGAKLADLDPSGFTLELGPPSPESHRRGMDSTQNGKGRDGHWEGTKGHAIAATGKAQQGGLICPSCKGRGTQSKRERRPAALRTDLLLLLCKPPELHRDAEQLAL